MKYCKDCRFAKRRWWDFVLFLGSYQLTQCTHPVSQSNMSDAMVTGKGGLFCTTMRISGCGPDAVLFEKKK